jgi:putative ABC transport system permease protein
MSALRQALQLLRMSLLSLPRRMGASLVVIIGMMGAVAALIAMLVVGAAFDHAIRHGGRPDRAFLLRKGATTEVSSAIPRSALTTIADAPGVRVGPQAQPLISAEALAATTLHRRADGSEAAGLVRGIGAPSRQVHPELHVVAGRYFRRGAHEVIVGTSAHRHYREMEIGQTLRAENNVDWQVVGIFAMDGDARESFALADVDALMSVGHRENYSSVTVLLQSPAAFEPFKAALSADPSVAIDVYRESDYLDRQGKGVSRLFSVLLYGIGAIMAVGAAFAAANTMFAAISVRKREMATLRAIGYRPVPTVLAVLAEAALLAMTGALLGATLAWLAFSGKVVGSSLGSSQAAQLLLELKLDPAYVAGGAALACLLGLAGGLLPALRAASGPVARALRKT